MRVVTVQIVSLRSTPSLDMAIIPVQGPKFMTVLIRDYVLHDVSHGPFSLTTMDTRHFSASENGR